MGRANRKMIKNNQKKQGVQKDVVLWEAKKKIQELQGEGHFDEALEKIIELLDVKNYDGDILFAAADTYFMVGDYERASVWVNNTFDYEPGHIGARILLARICMLKEKIEEALDIMEFVLRTTNEKLQPDETEKVDEILDYFRYTQDLEKLASSHPYTAKFMGITLTETLAEVDSKSNKRIELAEEDVKENLKNANQEAEKSSAAVKEEILQKDVSLQEKIVLLNSFAGAYYYENRVEDARVLLLAANSIDNHNDMTLKNLVILALDEKNQTLALEYAALMNKMDFSVIKMIKEN